MAIGNTLYGNTTPVRVSESGNPVVTIVVEQVFFLSFPCTFPTKLENLFHKNNRGGLKSHSKVTQKSLKSQPATAVSIAGSLDHAGGRIGLELGRRNRHRIIRILPYNIAFGGTRTGNRLVIFSFLTAYPEPAHILNDAQAGPGRHGYFNKCRIYGLHDVFCRSEDTSPYSFHSCISSSSAACRSPGRTLP